MTQTAMVANPARSIHSAGAVCLVAGLGGAAASFYLAVASPVGAENFMYPHGAPELTGQRDESRDVPGRPIAQT